MVKVDLLKNLETLELHASMVIYLVFYQPWY